MSGGVDSSVAAYLLLQQGFQVEGLFMKNWEEDDTEEYCSAAQDLADAQAVCDKLGIHLHAINFSAEYWDNVFEHFLNEYKIGRTPNPDILCNKEIKFKAFLEYACEDLHADYIATGHYVRKRFHDSHWQLLRGLDSNKDQSYFLYALSQEQIAKALFPVGELSKQTVRHIAETQQLVTARKKDSTGICFIGERKFTDFIGQFLPAKPGEIVDTDGNVIGHHQSLMFHTLGQRKGLGIGGRNNSSDEPWYVVDKEVSTNRLIVAQGKNHPKLYTQHLTASKVNWIGDSPDSRLNQPLTVKTRYRQQDIAAKITLVNKDSISVEFDSPVSAVTPGQSVVIYKGEICLGGAVID